MSMKVMLPSSVCQMNAKGWYIKNGQKTLCSRW